MSGPIAILGASSAIAGDFILATSSLELDLRLYARNPSKVDDFLLANGLKARWQVASMSDFGTMEYGAVINFIGVGDPARALRLGGEILAATLCADQSVISYLSDHPATRYVFMSSGAVYGTEFLSPANEGSKAEVPINQLELHHCYGVAKLYAEATHRALKQYNVFDIRIFNYISRRLDLNSKFLIAEMINAVRKNAVFRTDDRQITRDFLHPSDLHQLIAICLSLPPGHNMPIDAYSSAPITKSQLVELMAAHFGMKFEVVRSIETVNSTGVKPFYYSQNHLAGQYGYCPQYSSSSAILEEVRAILK